MVGPPDTSAAIQFVVPAGLMLSCGVVPSWTILLVPLFIAECRLVSLALGLWPTALSLKYRDITHLVPLLSQIWMYLTPIVYAGVYANLYASVYASSMVPER